MKKRPGTPPTVYVIAGPNGAGKTTFATNFLPDFVHCRQFLNADLIARGLAPFAPETQNVRAGRLLLARIQELAAAGEDFGFETTLSGRTYVKLLRDLQRRGYQLLLFFLWLPDVAMAMKHETCATPRSARWTQCARGRHPTTLYSRNGELLSFVSPAVRWLVAL